MTMKPTEELLSSSSRMTNTNYVDEVAMYPPHDCEYGHVWTGSLIRGVQYVNPSNRFCMQCLEEGRITVGSMMMHMLETANMRLELFCQSCKKQSLHHLIPDPRNMYTVDLHEVDYTKKIDRWFHLPERWPNCSHCKKRLLPEELKERKK